MPKRSGRKSAAQTPAPASERIAGSDRNRPGSAASQKAASKIVLSDDIVEALKKKAREFNESHPTKKVSLSTLKAVFRRGSGAYSKSHRPTITGNRPNTRTAWSYARVNKFLEKKAGRKVKKAYVQDDDLLEDGGIAIEKKPDIQYADGAVVFVRNESYDSSMTKRRLPYLGVSAFAVRTDDFERFKQYAEREEGVDPSSWTVLIPSELGDHGAFAMSMEDTNDYVMGFTDDKPELKPFDPEAHIMVIDQDGNLDYDDAHEVIIMPVRFIRGGMTAILVKDAIDSAKIIDRLVERALEEGINPHDMTAEEFKRSVDPRGEYSDFEIRLARREVSKYLKNNTTDMASGGKIKDMQIKCSKCGWSWDTSDSSPDDATTCHKCGHDNPQTDVISINTPTFLRAMEFAKEDAKTDMELHRVAENAARLSKEGPIEMAEYDQLVKFMAGGRLPDLTQDEVRLLRMIRKSGSLPRKFMDKEDISMANKLVAKGWLEKGTSGEKPHSAMYYVDLNREDLDRLDSYQLSGRIKKGDTVRIKNPYPDEDPNRDYLVVQDSIEEFGEDDGIDVMALGTGLSFPPINRIRMGDLRVVGKTMADGGETHSYDFTLFAPPRDGRLTAYQFSDPKEALIKAEELDIRSNGGKGYALRDTFTGRVIADGRTMVEALDAGKPLAGHEDIDIYAYEPRQYDFSEFMQKERDLSDALTHCDLTRLGKAMICQAKIDLAAGRGASAEDGDEKNAWLCVENHWRGCLKDCLDGPCVTYKRGGETWDCGCGKSYRKGGLAYGNSHDNGGIPLTVSSTGQDIEIEGGEGVVNKRSMQMTKSLSFEGKRLTPCEVVSKINEMGGGVKFKCGDVKKIIAEDGNYD